VSVTVAAVDLGATSGRVLLGEVGADRLAVTTVARFPNTPVRIGDGLHWSILELYRHVLDELAAAHRTASGLTSIGIDSWGCDYALLRDGVMLSNPYSHRDERTAAGVRAVHDRISPQDLFARNGLQHLPFTTLYQLAVDRQRRLLRLADTMLLIPDLLTHWLTGTTVAERTNASTTGLLRADTGEWDADLARRLDVDPALLPPLVDAGTDLGPIIGPARHETGIDGVHVTAVGSHDTASAVVAVPATDPDIAYISCGTWSLVGVELERPVLTDAARRAGFTNERGVDGRIRYLHNVTGLWLLTETIRDWERIGPPVDLSALLAQAADITGATPTFDADDPDFLGPGDMPARIAAALLAAGQSAPTSRPALVRTILASLAAAYARTIRAAAETSGHTIRTVHLVGGGSQNTLLCQLTADATGLPVLAGPAEATAIGNILIQARTLGETGGSLESLRALVARRCALRRYEPGRG